MRLAHVVHLPKSKHEHQPKNSQLQPDSHDSAPASLNKRTMLAGIQHAGPLSIIHGYVCQ
uniref:Uncharacterized protein n=1 Tax=uncultured proteobacterium DelRiverFos06H03 TaxID=311783 RepID=Q58PM2_9PROT|nr:hypothetical protein DelRiverFos06H03.29 [uncultured proteobacterium DelRiverFos06H03]